MSSFSPIRVRVLACFSLDLAKIDYLYEYVVAVFSRKPRGESETGSRLPAMAAPGASHGQV